MTQVKGVPSVSTDRVHEWERHLHDGWNDPLSPVVNCRWLHELQTCKEDFPEGGRLVYSSVTMLIQYLLPTITISVAYYQILGQLRMRLKQKKSQVCNKAPGREGRNHRMAGESYRK